MKKTYRIGVDLGGTNIDVYKRQVVRPFATQAAASAVQSVWMAAYDTPVSYTHLPP